MSDETEDKPTIVATEDGESLEVTLSPDGWSFLGVLDYTKDK